MNAATKIQASFRGHMARKQAEKVKQDTDITKEMEKLQSKVNAYFISCTFVMFWWRGFTTLNRVRPLTRKSWTSTWTTRRWTTPPPRSKPLSAVIWREKPSRISQLTKLKITQILTHQILFINKGWLPYDLTCGPPSHFETTCHYNDPLF